METRWNFERSMRFYRWHSLRVFQKAARHLGYSQAAITIQIKQLEQELDVHLFDRIGKQISLTRDGELFFEHANAIMQELTQARETLSRDRKLHGTLRIGTIESICTVLLPQVMKQYHILYPEVNVRITIDSPEILLNSLTNGTLDLVYILDQQIHDERFIKVLETPEEAVFTASSSNPFTGRQQIPLDEILSQPFILTERNASYRLMLDLLPGCQGTGDPSLSVHRQHRIHHPSADRKLQPVLPALLCHCSGRKKGTALRPGRGTIPYAGLEAGAPP